MKATRTTRRLPSHGPDFWQGIYETETRPGWDMGGPTPLVQELLEAAASLGLRPGPTFAVPGCGFGHDAAELARQGFQVTGIDFTEAALQGARSRHGDLVTWRGEDWFKGEEAFDALFDHTCFVAMAPARRAEYLEVCARRLRPGGLWLGVFFHTVTGGDGPPYPIAPEELRSLAAKRFDLLHLAQAQRSHPRRAGREFLVVARKRPLD